MLVNAKWFDTDFIYENTLNSIGSNKFYRHYGRMTWTQTLTLLDIQIRSISSLRKFVWFKFTLMKNLNKP